METSGYREVVDCGGTGLVLVPSVFSPGDRCSLLSTTEIQPSIFYPAHGVSETWHTAVDRTPRALRALVGGARSTLLVELQQPLSTSECAEVAGVAVSTAHHHLTVLRDAGLIDSGRQGARVFHTRTPLDEALSTVS